MTNPVATEGPNAEQRIERVIEKALCNYVIGDPGGATPLIIDALKQAGYAIVPVQIQRARQ